MRKCEVTMKLKMQYLTCKNQELVQSLEDHTQLFQLGFKQSSFCRLYVKFTKGLGFGLKFVLI